MGEPEKAICYLTDIQGYDKDHLASFYNKASLHAICPNIYMHSWVVMIDQFKIR